MTEAKTYTVTARKDGRWWLVEVPELGTAGQARSATEVDEVAREVIGLWLDVEPDSFGIEVTFNAPEEVRAVWDWAKRLEVHAVVERDTAAALSRRAVDSLRVNGWTFAEAATVLGITPQRAAQLGGRPPVAAPVSREDLARELQAAIDELELFTRDLAALKENDPARVHAIRK